MWRADPLQPADPALCHSSGTLEAPQGAKGPSTPLYGHERAGDGVSPAARQQEKISPESPEETWVAQHRDAC